MRRIVACLAIAALASGCAGAPLATPDAVQVTPAASDDPSPGATERASPAPTRASAPVSTPIPTATATAQAGLPSYEEVVATYPASTELCTTRTGISGGEGGSYSFEDFDGAESTIEIRGGEMLFWCLGAQYTVTGPMVGEDGQPIPLGALLTLDADSNFVQVSGW